MIIHDNGMMEGKPHEIIARRRENQIKASLKHGVNYTEYESLAEAERQLRIIEEAK